MSQRTHPSVDAHTCMVITESYFGCTQSLGQAIAAELGCPHHSLATAPAQLPPTVTLVFLGAPTHNASLPTPASRAQAHSQLPDSPAAPRDTTPTREWESWLATALTSPCRVAVFDTCVTGGTLFGSAAKKLSKRARNAGLTHAAAPAHFRVAGTPPQLRPDEVHRAVDWASSVATSPAG